MLVHIVHKMFIGIRYFSARFFSNVNQIIITTFYNNISVLNYVIINFNSIN